MLLSDETITWKDKNIPLLLEFFFINYKSNKGLLIRSPASVFVAFYLFLLAAKKALAFCYISVSPFVNWSVVLITYKIECEAKLVGEYAGAIRWLNVLSAVADSQSYSQLSVPAFLLRRGTWPTESAASLFKSEVTQVILSYYLNSLASDWKGAAKLGLGIPKAGAVRLFLEHFSSPFSLPVYVY